MKKLAILLIAALTFSACFFNSKEEVAAPEKILRNIKPLKTVEIYDLATERAKLSFQKSGITSASETAYVSPQIAGRITGINVKVGDQVRKGDNLITLGESLSTDLIDLQYQTALQGYNLAQNSQYYTGLTGETTLEAAQIGVQMAQKAYLNAIQNKDHSENILLEQYENAEIEVDNAKEAKDMAKDSEEDLEDLLDDLEDQLDELEDQIDDLTDPDATTELEAAKKELEAAISATESQLNAAESSGEIAKNREEQARNALSQLEETIEFQLNQLSFGILAARDQLELALRQFESAKAGIELQAIGAESQLLQATAGLESSELTKEQQTIKAPINGKITTIMAKEGNITAPEQILLKIENDQTLIVKTSINQQESELISVGDNVVVESDGKNAKGKVTSISPALNEMTKKLDVKIEITGTSNILIGSFAKIYFSPSTRQTLFIPINSVFPEEGKKFVHIVDSKNRIQKLEVELGKIVGEYAEILQGLRGNEQLIRTINNFLEENEKVRIVKKIQRY